MDLILSYFAVRPSNRMQVPSHFDFPSFTNLSIAIFCCLAMIFASGSFFLSMAFYAKPSINIRSYLILFRIIQLFLLPKPSLRPPRVGNTLLQKSVCCPHISGFFLHLSHCHCPITFDTSLLHCLIGLFKLLDRLNSSWFCYTSSHICLQGTP